jgi:hypothetical protein
MNAPLCTCVVDVGINPLEQPFVYQLMQPTMTVMMAKMVAAETVMLTMTAMMPATMKTTAMTTMTQQWHCAPKKIAQNFCTICVLQLRLWCEDAQTKRTRLRNRAP